MNKTEVLQWLERNSSRANRDGLARYGIVAKQPLGVSMAKLQALKKKLGRDQELSLQLWQTGIYEARLLAALVGEPAQVTKRQMDAWAKSFENWADCDTACFHLFDRSPHAWGKVAQWAKAKGEFVKRAAFALLASLALHDKAAADAAFEELLPLVEREAGDERNFVKKAVSWALRGVGRRSAKLHMQAVAMAQRLAKSEVGAARWVGKDALKDLQRAMVKAKVGVRARGVSGSGRAARTIRPR